ncbi:unnamed protein product [Sphagnum jensenii]|uniref:Pentatricopeptide repeat-containing protein n=1 Tax=Sphagnum jensenii TaxID=128206 RepID=A0ABP1A317_9BRYO
MQLFQEMRQGVSPNKFTFIQVIKVCGPLRTLEDGRLVHKQLIQTGCESDVFVGSSLVDRYAKCGSIEDAWRVFNKMPSQNVVTWSTMILRHVKCGQGQKALGFFQQMQQEVNMYAKCGSMEDAWRVFNKMPSQTVVTWNAILGGCAMNGHGKEALKYFEQIIHGNVEMAERVARRILEMEPDNVADYGLPSNIYAAGGNWHLCENVKLERGKMWDEIAGSHLD